MRLPAYLFVSSSPIDNRDLAALGPNACVNTAGRGRRIDGEVVRPSSAHVYIACGSGIVFFVFPHYYIENSSSLDHNKQSVWLIVSRVKRITRH